jgi:UDP-glucose 4-epimerase
VQQVRTWVIGAGGLVGSAVVRRPELDVFDGASIPWGSEAALSVLETELNRFSAWADGHPWALVWAAGSGVMLTGEDVLAAEVDTFTGFCERVAVSVPQARGGFYLVSSAGGVYAGSQNPPFGAGTAPVPANAYGRAKLRQEEVLERWCAGRTSITIGRLANVYGPGQDLRKMQGLVTQLCLSALLGRPARVFAPLATLRDYIYVDDAARMVVDDVIAMTRPVEPAGATVRRVVCSGRSATIAELIAMVENVTGRPVPLVHLLPGAGSIVDLRLAVARDHPLDRSLMTPLEVGVGLVWQDLVDQLAAGRLAALI